VLVVTDGFLHLQGVYYLRIDEHPILCFEKRKTVKFVFEDLEMYGYEDEPISAALHAAGIDVLSRSPKHNRARGFFCAIGNCSSCLMEVDGVPNVRVCTERLREGMVVRRQSGRGVIAEPEDRGGHVL